MEIPTVSGDDSFEVDLNDTNLGVFDALMQEHNRYDDVASLTDASRGDQRAARFALVAAGLSPYDARHYDSVQAKRHFEGNPNQQRNVENMPDLPPEAKQWLGGVCSAPHVSSES